MRRRRIFAIWTLALVACSFGALAERGDDSNRQSKNGRATGVIDGVDVTIDYGRPRVRGREIWGDLVPFDRVWRTGADETTTIEFSDDVTVEGEALPAGRYGLFTVPSENSWTVIFNNTPEQWGAFGYDMGDDALRVEVDSRSADHVEAMTFELIGEEVVLRWATLEIGFRVAAGN